MASFDKAIPPGGEGKITLKVNLKGYQGAVKKNATVTSNDPANPRVVLTVQGNVKTLIEVKPNNIISLRGLPDQLAEVPVDLIGSTESFNIENIETNIQDKIKYQLETVVPGKHYRLKIANVVKQGSYNGYVKLKTNLAQKPDIMIRVNGFIEGELSVKPQTVLIGKLAAQQPVRSTKVIVTSNRGKQFKITKLTYDSNLLSVTQQPNGNNYTLELLPKLEGIAPGARQQTVLTIETDAAPGEKYEVQVHILNSVEGTPPQPGQQPAK